MVLMVLMVLMMIMSTTEASPTSDCLDVVYLSKIVVFQEFLPRQVGDFRRPAPPPCVTESERARVPVEKDEIAACLC